MIKSMTGFGRTVLEKDGKVITVEIRTLNSKQLDFLQNANCSIIQGFIFDKPLTKEEFELRLSNKMVAYRCHG